MDRIGENIANGLPVKNNEEILGEISSVSELLYDVIQKFVAAEMEIAHIQNSKIQRSLDLMTVFFVALFASILAFLFRNYRVLNRSINDPIYRLKTMASRIARGMPSATEDRTKASIPLYNCGTSSRKPRK